MRDTLEQTSIPVKKLERIKNVTVDNYNGKDLQLISSALRKYTNAFLCCRFVMDRKYIS